MFLRPSPIVGSSGSRSALPLCRLVGSSGHCGRYFNVMLRYPVLHRSSRSMVIDAVRPAAAMPEMYPCFSRGMDIRRTLVAMELLKKNMEQLLASQKIQYPPAYPPNLLLQLHVLFHARRSEMQGLGSFFARVQLTAELPASSVLFRC